MTYHFNGSQKSLKWLNCGCGEFVVKTILSIIISECEERQTRMERNCYFVRTISNLWKIINVKNQTIGIHKRDEFRKPVTSSTDWKLRQLQDHQNLFLAMKSISDCGISSETTNACILMSSALQKLSFLLFEQHNYKYMYILLGQMQNDALEHRFGRLRQISSENFFIGYKQLLESERCLKVVFL